MIYGAGTIVPRLLNYLLLTPFYTRVFLQGQYGVITELYAYVAFLMVLLTYGMETAYFRYASSENNSKKAYSTALVSLLTTTLLFIVVVLFLAQPIADLIRYASNKEYIIYFTFIVGIDAFTAIPFAKLRQENKPFRFAIIKIINVLVNIVLNFFFLIICPILLKHNPESVVRFIYSEDIGVGYAFISNLIASLITLILLFPELFRIKVYFDFDLLKKMLVYAFPLLVVGLAGMVNDVSDKILLKYFVSIPPGTSDPGKYAMTQVGIYGANYKLAVLMTLFIQMFRYAAEPFFFTQAKNDRPQQVYSDVMKYFVISCLIIFMAVMMYIDIVKYFIGPDFRSGLKIVPIVLLANLFLGVFYNLSIWYKLTNRTLYGAIIALAGAFITIILNVLLIPLFGYEGSAWATLICYLFMMVACYFFGMRYYPINYDLRSFFGYMTLSLSLYGLSVVLKIENTIIRLIVNSFFMLAFLVTIFIIEKRNFMRIYR
jgi:O-antigen/teichoic acid export membrane protein